MHQEPVNLLEIEKQLVALAQMEHVADANDIWMSRLDGILPPDAYSTDRYAREKLYVKARGERKAKYDPLLTPYTEGINNACDMRGVNVVAVKGNARGGKTLSAEAHALKRMEHGPYGDMLWYMQSGDDVDDYMEERGEWMLENHEGVAERVDHAYKRQARNRKRIGESIARWLAATANTTRGKAAPFIVADEIDGYSLKIAKSILTRLLNRQREYGSAGLMYICSHPDIGPQFGIEAILRQSLRHLWWWLCLHCGKPSSPAAEAPIRMNWNLPHLMPQISGVERVDALDFIKKEVRLICPHCQGEITNEERLIMSRETGAWVQPAQKLIAPRRVEGVSLVEQKMGFTIHGFMSPFTQLTAAAEEWANAKLDYDNTLDDTDLKEATVKTLGEIYEGATADVKIDEWSVISKRMKSGDAYTMGVVPDGVDFLTAFVDIQKGFFAVRVIGWDAEGRQSWLIDAFEIKAWQKSELAQRLGKRNLQKLNPFSVLSDWAILEEAVLEQSYPLQRDPNWHMPIAKVGIDTGGEDDTAWNARVWAASVIHREVAPVKEWRILLLKGSSWKKGEHLYGLAKSVLRDDRGQTLPEDGRSISMLGPVWERVPIVFAIKKIVRKRQNVLTPGPGFMHAPQDLPEEYFRELVSEKLIGGEWVKTGNNETWDAYVGCETVRASLNPDDPQINWNRPPIWARPFRIGVDPGIDAKPPGVVSPYARMVRVNKRK